MRQLAVTQTALPATRPAAAGPTLSWPALGERYRVVEEIARGGMGVVLRVIDVQLDRPLAVKVLSVAGGASEQRFLEEARIAGQLQHPGVAPVHEIGRLADGRPFFAMKLIEGRTLSDLLRQRPSAADDLPRMMQIFEQIAQTVAYAHSHGVIHRDLKPLNVMVGAFGEVQVLDWGLAKRLGQPGNAARSEASSGNAAAHDTAAAEHASALAETKSLWDTRPPSSSDGDRTSDGQVLGTPAYMPPEQARGQIDALDERSDVFGLGAILCEILTGRPPYRGQHSVEIYRLAAAAELTDAYTRLDQCTVDAELTALCRSCLDADRARRPADATEVAKRVADYLTSVQQRLEEARVEQAAAAVRAAEQRRRLRLAIGLAAAVVLLVTGAAAAGTWYFRDQALREAEVASRRSVLERSIQSDLDEAERLHRDLHARLADQRQAAELLSNLDLWRKLTSSAHDAWARADRLAAADRALLSPGTAKRLASVGNVLADDARDRDLAFELDRVRALTLQYQHQDSRFIAGFGQALPEYDKVFLAAGYNFKTEDSVFNEKLGERVRHSPIRQTIIAALDFWLLTGGERRPVEVARLADPDPWRNRYRDIGPHGTLADYERLAAEAGPAEQYPAILGMLANLIRARGGDSRPLLERSLAVYPQDYWLLLEMAQTISGTEARELAAAYRAVLAVRPDDSFSLANLASALNAQGQYSAAVARCRRALALEPQNHFARHGLGVALYYLGRYAEAIPELQRACDFLPYDANTAHTLASLARCHYAQGDLALAEKFLLRSLSIDANNAGAYYNLGQVYRLQGQLQLAERCLRRASEYDPDSAGPRNVLAWVLREQGRLDEAVTHHHRGLILDPAIPLAWNMLGATLYAQRNFPAAEAAHRKAIELEPTMSTYRSDLAATLLELDQFVEAQAAAQQAIEIDPQNASAHRNLGVAFIRQDRWEEAQAAFDLAHALEPESGKALKTLATELSEHGRLEDAVAVFEKCLAVVPNDAEAHTNFGNALLQLRRLPEAIEHHRRAVSLSPRLAEGWSNLGAALFEARQFAEAEQSFRRALELAPELAMIHFNLGNALNLQHRLEEAIAAYRRAVELDPQFAVAWCYLGQQLVDNRQFAEAARAIRRGHEMGSRRPGWNLPSIRWLGEAEAMARLDRKLPAALRGEPVGDAMDLFALARFCLERKGQPADALRLFEAAFQQQPNVMEDPLTATRYNAACAAILMGKAAEEAQRRKELFTKAHQWLRADLTALEGLLAKEPAQQPTIKSILAHWQSDPDLAAVRDEAALGSLPPDEREPWQAIWADIARLGKR